ncbi:hypothetical protein KPL71_018983 [Citrus sinensis]|uniref:Uncharacterized protein n=1 Tax=Citrus sinensis TaxID=2711 RepID=A0ACB8K2C6_CITSI|nr:hypothetical protein KPL71_018983 [Citrus sinensis]
MPLACAMEILITTADSLDDLPCLDNVDSRRGKPANHKVFSEATSVLACQALLSFAIDLIATRTKNVSPGHLLRVIADICLGNEEETERPYKYGKCVGLAYQVWDDTSDMEKDSRDDKATYVNVVVVGESGDRLPIAAWCDRLRATGACRTKRDCKLIMDYGILVL